MARKTRWLARREVMCVNPPYSGPEDHAVEQRHNAIDARKQLLAGSATYCASESSLGEQHAQGPKGPAVARPERTRVTAAASSPHGSGNNSPLPWVADCRGSSRLPTAHWQCGNVDRVHPRNFDPVWRRKFVFCVAPAPLQQVAAWSPTSPPASGPDFGC